MDYWLYINGNYIDGESINNPEGKNNPWNNELSEFLSDWYSDSKTIKVNTSGSTGNPKSILVYKKAMVESAVKTINFFNLVPGQNVLLCLPVSFIAGKMMVVRALVGHLNLVVVEPSGLPLNNVNKIIDFAAFTPMQMINELALTSNSKLKYLKKVIIGGGPVNDHLYSTLQNHSFEAYETYGMTETLSHVAIRRLNGNNPQKYFYPLPGVRIMRDDRGCLILNVKGVTNGNLITNDVVDITPVGSFSVTGRIDNVINSGGIKVQPEKLEKLINSITKSDFVISSVPDSLLGEKIVLVTRSMPGNVMDLFTLLSNHLSKYELPASLYLVDNFPVTNSDKLIRNKLRLTILEQKPVYSR